MNRIAQEGNAVIVGRGAPYFLRENPDAFHVFLYAPRAEKIRRIVADGYTQEEAEEMVDSVDRERIAYVKHYFNADWPTRSLYHMMLNTAVGNEPVIKTILETMHLVEGRPKATDYETPKARAQQVILQRADGCAGTLSIVTFAVRDRPQRRRATIFSHKHPVAARASPAPAVLTRIVRSRISSRIIAMNLGCTPTVFALAIGKASESQSWRASISRSYRNFHMIGDETDRRQHNRARQIVSPLPRAGNPECPAPARAARGSAAALINQSIVARFPATPTPAFALPPVAARSRWLRHRERNAMRDVDDLHIRARASAGISRRRRAPDLPWPR